MVQAFISHIMEDAMFYAEQIKNAELVMLVWHDLPKHSEDHGHVVAQFYRLVDGELQGTIGSVVNGWLLDSLRIDAWYCKEYPKLNYGSMFESIRYQDVYQVCQHRAEHMSKTLRKLESGMQKLYEDEGSTESFGEYLIRVARVMKIMEFMIQTTPGINDYERCDGGTLKRRVNDIHG